MLGYIWYDTTQTELRNMGGVRSESTGFYMASGENFAIGTSTPVLADVHIYKDSTSTLALDGTVMGCIKLLDKTTGGSEYYISDNQEWATTTAADCGF